MTIRVHVNNGLGGHYALQEANVQCYKCKATTGNSCHHKDGELLPRNTVHIERARMMDSTLKA